MRLQHRCFIEKIRIFRLSTLPSIIRLQHEQFLEYHSIAGTSTGINVRTNIGTGTGTANRNRPLTLYPIDFYQ